MSDQLNSRSLLNMPKTYCSSDSIDRVISNLKFIRLFNWSTFGLSDSGVETLGSIIGIAARNHATKVLETGLRKESFAIRRSIPEGGVALVRILLFQNRNEGNTIVLGGIYLMGSGSDEESVMAELNTPKMTSQPTGSKYRANMNMMNDRENWTTLKTDFWVRDRKCFQGKGLSRW